jgi:hypothetical protein
MSKIMRTAHFCYDVTYSADTFYQSVNESIDQMQEAGLEVEVQYQQSSRCISAFIIGREKDKDKYSIEELSLKTAERIAEQLSNTNDRLDRRKEFDKEWNKWGKSKL